MPHRTRPVTALLLFTGLNAVLVSTITPVDDFACFLPYWKRRLANLRMDTHTTPATSVDDNENLDDFEIDEEAPRECRHQEREEAVLDQSSGIA